MRRIEHLYIHVPFCRHKCGYCDFNAYAGMERLLPAFVDALARELADASRRLPFGPLRTVYLGGGTPSLLDAALATSLLDHVRKQLPVRRDAEVTLEANPASTDLERLTAWRSSGVNRLSLGVQGFDPHALAVLERRSDGAQARRAFAEARAAGFDNVSLDLIYAVPGQSDGAWLDTVEQAVALRPEHLSCYCLSFEEGTLLFKRRARGLLAEVAADRQWELQQLAASVLRRAGYRRYEVSSWSLPGRRSRHNGAYWACRPFYGAGPGAHSYAIQGGRARRWWNVAHPRTYIAQSPDVVAGSEDLDPRLSRAERLLLGLRTVRGLPAPRGFERELRRLQEAGLVRLNRRWASPTERGLDLHNQIALTVL